MRPLRVAVVGSGPAGFYAADALLKSEDPRVEVDVLDRLPTPWGLVRLGVAPDHENIKAVSRAFVKTAAREGFRFFGNVEVGSTVGHDDLLRLYDAVVFTVDAQTVGRPGRGGPPRAAITPPAPQTAGEPAGAEPVAHPAALEVEPASAAALEHERERARRNAELLEEYAAREPEGKPRPIVMRF